MGKPKARGARAARKTAGSKNKRPAEEKYTIEDLLGKAAELLDECQFDAAEKFCQRALEMDGDNVVALEMSANLLVERGEVERAQHCLGRAITVCPDSGHTKYLTAAQLFTGSTSRDLYCRAVELLTREGLTHQLSSAYVALSELYMSDLCDEPEAQTEAENYISLALEADPGNPESWQAQANYRLVTEQFEAAKESMRKSLLLWLPQHSAFLQTGEGTETSLSYTSRITTVQLLLDLEMLDEATQIAEGLIEEDDEVVAPWYLLGWLNYLREDPDYWGNVRHYLARAREVHVRNPTDDTEMVKHIQEILAEVGEEEQEEEASQTREGIDLDDEDQERLEKVADILDKESEPDCDNRMES